MKYSNIDEYISLFPAKTQDILKSIRKTIREVAPKSEETISYGIPTFKLNGNLVHFAAYSKHIGFYPGSSGIKVFRKYLAKYNISKGTVQFPIDEPIPLSLVKKITRHRVLENRNNAKK